MKLKYTVAFNIVVEDDRPESTRMYATMTKSGETKEGNHVMKWTRGIAKIITFINFSTFCKETKNTTGSRTSLLSWWIPTNSLWTSIVSLCNNVTSSSILLDPAKRSPWNNVKFRSFKCQLSSLPLGLQLCLPIEELLNDVFSSGGQITESNHFRLSRSGDAKCFPLLTLLLERTAPLTFPFIVIIRKQSSTASEYRLKFCYKSLLAPLHAPDCFCHHQEAWNVLQQVIELDFLLIDNYFCMGKDITFGQMEKVSLQQEFDGVF